MGWTRSMEAAWPISSNSSRRTSPPDLASGTNTQATRPAHVPARLKHSRAPGHPPIPPPQPSHRHRPARRQHWHVPLLAEHLAPRPRQQHLPQPLAPHLRVGIQRLCHVSIPSTDGRFLSRLNQSPFQSGTGKNPPEMRHCFLAVAQRGTFDTPPPWHAPCSRTFMGKYRKDGRLCP